MLGGTFTPAEDLSLRPLPIGLGARGQVLREYSCWELCNLEEPETGPGPSGPNATRRLQRLAPGEAIIDNPRLEYPRV